jgi:hypothetical protein
MNNLLSNRAFLHTHLYFIQNSLISSTYQVLLSKIIILKKNRIYAYQKHEG